MQVSCDAQSEPATTTATASSAGSADAAASKVQATSAASALAKADLTAVEAAPRMFRQLVGRGHEEFSTGKQQVCTVVHEYKSDLFICWSGMLKYTSLLAVCAQCASFLI